MISESYLSEASRVPAANQAADAAILTPEARMELCGERDAAEE